MFLCVIFISCFVTFSTTIPPFQIPSGWGTMSQGLKGIQSLTESDSFNESEE